MECIGGMLKSVGAFLPPNYKCIRERYFDNARRSLGEGAFEAAVAEGRAMSLTQLLNMQWRRHLIRTPARGVA